MPDLKTFLANRAEEATESDSESSPANGVALIGTNTRLAIVSTLAALSHANVRVGAISSLSTDAKTKFADSAAQVTASDEFITELSSNVGQPKTGETEDEFVERAKATMTALLREKLDR